MTDSPSEIKYRYKNIVLFIAAAFSGVILGVLAQLAKAAVAPDWFVGTLTIGAEALLIAGLLSVVYEFFLRRELLQMVRDGLTSLRVEIEKGNAIFVDYIKLMEGSDKLGLKLVAFSANKFEYDSYFMGDSELWIVMNDGRTWVSNHSAALTKRFRDPAKKTNLVLIARDSSFIDVLCKKVKSTPDKFKDKLDETISLIKDYSQGTDSRIKIFAHQLPTTYSLILNDHAAVLIPYPMAQKADDIPAYVFENKQDGYYHSLKEDLNALINESKQISPPAMF